MQTKPSEALPQIVVSAGPDEHHGRVVRIYDFPANQEVTRIGLGLGALEDWLYHGGPEMSVSYGYFLDATHFRRYSFGDPARLQIIADLDGARKMPGALHFILRDISNPHIGVTLAG